ncbi:hypothetical protein [Shewanella gaetbuli]
MYQLLPPFLPATAMYAFMANGNKTQAWSYAVTVLSLGFLLGTMILSLLMQQIYISPTWFVELSLSVVSAITGTLIGTKWRAKKEAIK